MNARRQGDNDANEQNWRCRHLSPAEFLRRLTFQPHHRPGNRDSDHQKHNGHLEAHLVPHEGVTPGDRTQWSRTSGAPSTTVRDRSLSAHQTAARVDRMPFARPLQVRRASTPGFHTSTHCRINVVVRIDRPPLLHENFQH